MKNVKGKKTFSSVVSDLVEIQIKLDKLPKLSGIEKTKIENEVAISQLYNSSRLEGSRLTDKMVERAMFPHGI